MVSGRVLALGVPMAGVEVLAAAGSSVVARVRTDRDGAYAFTGLGQTDRIVARFLEPFVGVAECSPSAGDLVIERADIVRLSASANVPEATRFDWADVLGRIFDAAAWRRCFTEAVPRDDLDFVSLGEGLELAGGHIKSAVVRAAFMAASSGGTVTRELLRRAAHRERESTGKLGLRFRR